MNHKKTIIILLLVAITIGCTAILSACNVIMDINFIVDDEIYATVKTSGYETIKLPPDPQKEGEIFDGWYWDYGTWREPFSVNSMLNTALSSNMKVYAKWKSDEVVNNDKNDVGESKVEIVDPLSPINKQDCYILTRTDGYCAPEAYQDKNFYYNIYYIGRVKNVPVRGATSLSSEIINYQGSNYEYEIKLSEITTNSVKKTISTVFSNTTTVGVEVGAEIGVTFFGLIETKIGSSTSAENTFSWGVDKTTEIYNKTVREVTTKRTQSFEGAEPGYYRYTLFVNLDEFVILRKSKSTGEIETLPYSKIVGDPCYSWEYRPDSSIFDYNIPKFEYTSADFPEFDENGEELTVPSNIGSQEAPMVVYTAQELIDSLKKNYELIKIGQNIDMSTVANLVPVEYFNGTLDGDGKKLSNLKIEALSSGKYAGLVGKLEGNIKNITFENPEITVTSSNNNVFAGIVAGEVLAGGSITNCQVNNCKIDAKAKEFQIADGARYCVVGGIVGRINTGAEVDGCTVNGGSISGYSLRHDTHRMGGMNEAPFVYIGGVVGELTSGSVKNCCSTGNLNINARAEVRISAFWAAEGNVWARICMGGIIGRQTSGTVESGNRTTNVILNNPTFNAWNDNNGGIRDKNFEIYKPKTDENQNVGRIGS